MDRGYKGGEIDTQLERVKGLQRDTLLNRESKSKDGTRIPLVLTFHPALNEAHEILRKCENILLVDREHRRVFSGKLFVSFRRAENFKDTLVRANYNRKTRSWWKKVHISAMVEGAKYAR